MRSSEPCFHHPTQLILHASTVALRCSVFLNRLLHLMARLRDPRHRRIRCAVELLQITLHAGDSGARRGLMLPIVSDSLLQSLSWFSCRCRAQPCLLGCLCLAQVLSLLRCVSAESSVSYFQQPINNHTGCTLEACNAGKSWKSSCSSSPSSSPPLLSSFLLFPGCLFALPVFFCR